MDTPTLIGTGFLVLAVVLWIVCAVYAYQNAPQRGRNAWTWGIIAFVLGPIGLMLLFVLPKREPVAGSGHAKQTKRSEQEALYEVPKKHR